MSETAEEKSKRAFLKLFREHEWENQITVFFNDYDQRLNFLDYSKNIRRKLARYRPGVGFLWLHLLSKIRVEDTANTDDFYYHFKNESPNGVVMPCITFFTYPRLSSEEFQDFVEGLLNIHSLEKVPVYIKRRTLDSYRCLVIGERFKRQKPHNLKKYFDLAKGPKRFGVINKPKLVTLEDVYKKRPSTEE
jgi:hypothetical protein